MKTRRSISKSSKISRKSTKTSILEEPKSPKPKNESKQQKFELKLTPAQIQKLFLNSEIRKKYPFDPIENKENEEDTEEESENQENEYSEDDESNKVPDVAMAYFKFPNKKYAIAVAKNDTFDDVSKNFKLPNRNYYIMYTFGETNIFTSNKVMDYKSTPSNPFICHFEENLYSDNKSPNKEEEDDDEDLNQELMEFFENNEILSQIQGDPILMEKVQKGEQIDVYDRRTRTYQTAKIPSFLLKISKFAKPGNN